jgi:hypothetical protein
VTDEPDPAAATVQLITIVELASLSITVCPAASTFTMTSRIAIWSPAASPSPRCLHAVRLEHPVVAVLRGEDLPADGLVIPRLPPNMVSGSASMTTVLDALTCPNVGDPGSGEPRPGSPRSIPPRSMAVSTPAMASPA